MGIDRGFDMVPRLALEAADKSAWRSFMALVQRRYKGDPQFECASACLLFKAGEHPRLPLDGHKFLRFSSKVSGRPAAATGVERYIEEVEQMARSVFGGRIVSWDEGHDQYGHYSWSEVYEAFESSGEKPEPSNVSNNSAQDSLPYKITDIPGKGRAMVAIRNITRGTRIIIEKPLIVAQSGSLHELEPAIAALLKDLSRTEQRQFLSLHNNHPGRFPFSGIMKTNALPCGPGSTIGGVYPTISLINHSCLPNAHNNWNDVTRHETIHAVRSISEGEEVTISYTAEDDSGSRRQNLKTAFGFDCACAVCALSQEKLLMSDRRRLEIKRLDDEIGNPMAMRSNPAKSLGACYRLLQLLKEEYNDSAVASSARLYYDAFQICVAHGDKARASALARLMYQSRVICEGEDSPETARAKALITNPENHTSFCFFSSRWRSSRHKDPAGDCDDKWLWRLD